MPKLSRGTSRGTVVLALALLAALCLAPAAVAEETPAAPEPLPALDAPRCEDAPVLPFLEDEAEAPRAASCTCPAEAHACVDHADCDAYCGGCSGVCVKTRASVCGWIEVPFPKVCNCA